MNDYIKAMVKMKTSGLDITVLILCQMFNLSCILLIDDFMWKSIDIQMEDFDIYLLMFKGGRFVSATKNDGSRILVEIPKCAQSILEHHPDYYTFKALHSDTSSKTDGEPQASENCQNQLNNTDIMMSGIDAFSGKYKFCTCHEGRILIINLDLMKSDCYCSSLHMHHVYFLIISPIQFSTSDCTLQIASMLTKEQNLENLKKIEMCLREINREAFLVCYTCIPEQLVCGNGLIVVDSKCGLLQWLRERSVNSVDTSRMH